LQHKYGYIRDEMNVIKDYPPGYIRNPLSLFYIHAQGAYNYYATQYHYDRHA